MIVLKKLGVVIDTIMKPFTKKTKKKQKKQSGLPRTSENKVP